MSTRAEKIVQLQQIQRIQIFEVVAVTWRNPNGTENTHYYGSTAVDEFAGVPFSDVEPRFSSKGFFDFELNPDVSDDVITLDFSDLDQEIANRFYANTEGIRVEILNYFPQVDLLESAWFGHLQSPKTADYGRFKADAVAGLVSSQRIVPHRAFYGNCPAIFGGLLPNQEPHNRNDCPYNRHIGGSIGLLTPEGNPFTDCPQYDLNDCIARLDVELGKASFMGFDTTKIQPLLTDPGAGTRSASRGNETNLKRPLRVVFGAVIIKDFDLLASRKEYVRTTNNERFGWISTLWAVCEGPVRSIHNINVANAPIQPYHSQVRDGELRQGPTTYSPDVPPFSGTVHLHTRQGEQKLAVEPKSFPTSAECHGLENVRVYSSPSDYIETFVDSRAWSLMEIYRNKRWGLGYDDSRFDVMAWNDCADWASKFIRFRDPFGNSIDERRDEFHIDLSSQPAAQHILEICRTGRISAPFQRNGKLAVVPLRQATSSELDNAPVFTDTGDECNILRESSGKPMISYSQIPIEQLTNKLVLTFIDSAIGHIERPVTFENQRAQIKAGRQFGESSRRIVEKRLTAPGVRNLKIAKKLGWALLNLGEFDNGGLLNNLRVTFTTWFQFALGLEKYQILKVNSPLISRFGFQYFRVLSRRRRSNLQVEITAQAYPVEYYNNFEVELAGPTPTIPTIPTIPPDTGNPSENPPENPSENPTTPTTTTPTCRLGLGEITYAEGKLQIEILPC